MSCPLADRVRQQEPYSKIAELERLRIEDWGNSTPRLSRYSTGVVLRHLVVSPSSTQLEGMAASVLEIQ